RPRPSHRASLHRRRRARVSEDTSSGRRPAPRRRLVVPAPSPTTSRSRSGRGAPSPCAACLCLRRLSICPRRRTPALCYDAGTTSKARIASVEADLPDNRMSDGRIDPRGRVWAATLSLSGRQHGALYRLDADGRVLRMLTGLTLSNGLDWSPDGALLYLVDTA